MIFITGGAYQGKRKYAEKKYGVRAVDGAKADIEQIRAARCVSGFHMLIRRALEREENPLEMTEKIIRENPGIIIIMNEIGGGIVPLDRSERVWREAVGNVGCLLAERADRVDRIICGTAVRIK